MIFPEKHAYTKRLFLVCGLGTYGTVQCRTVTYGEVAVLSGFWVRVMWGVVPYRIVKFCFVQCSYRKVQQSSVTSGTIWFG